MNIYETHTMKDARLPFIFHDSTVSADRHSNTYNWHENIEIICTVSGKGVAICDGERVEMDQGEIVVVNPNSLHGYTADGEALRYFCLIIDRSFFLFNHFDSNDYIFDNKIKDSELSELVMSFGKIWTNTDIPMRVQKLRCIALNIATLLCERYGRFDSNPRVEPKIMSAVKQAIGYIRAESHKDISLDDIAAFVGISKYYFSREFRRVTGYSFVEYLNVVRCEKARKALLDENVSIGEVGRMCGFRNQSYFTRTFYEYVGEKPGTYRKNKRL